MTNPFAPVERRQMLLAASIALIAGYLDAYTLLKLGVYVSFMSGNTIKAGLGIGGEHVSSAVAPILAIACFVFGGFAGTWITTEASPHRRRWLFLMSAILLIVVGFLHWQGFRTSLDIACLSVATGLLNPAMSHIGPESVSLTFVSGALTRIGKHLALGMKGASLSGAEGPWDTHFHRALIDVSMWLAFFTGAVISAILLSRMPKAALPLAIAWIAALALSERHAGGRSYRPEDGHEQNEKRRR